MAHIIHARTDFHFDQVRLLMREYRDAVIAIADESNACTCFDAFDAELEQLPGAYAPPRGRLLLGLTPSLVAGMIALRPVDARTGEIKRLYVRPAARRQGVGLALVTALVAEARAAGYAVLCLETLPAMRAAQALYHALGFRETERFRPPTGESDRVVSMALRL